MGVVLGPNACGVRVAGCLKRKEQQDYQASEENRSYSSQGGLSVMSISVCHTLEDSSCIPSPSLSLLVGSGSVAVGAALAMFWSAGSPDLRALFLLWGSSLESSGVMQQGLPGSSVCSPSRAAFNAFKVFECADAEIMWNVQGLRAASVDQHGLSIAPSLHPSWRRGCGRGCG